MADKKIFVLGIDGVPYSFLQDEFNKGNMPNLATLCKKDTYKRMNSVYPTVSSVAWTTFSTGLNPGGHNIFGFVDRSPNPFQVRIPTARDIKGKTLWRHLSEKGKKVIVINVPLTFPPEEVNGYLASCFLCTDINKVSASQIFTSYLKDKGYIIDVDAWLAQDNKKRFMNELHKAMEKRFEITFDLIDGDEWDYFHMHIMETDRMLHFFWHDYQTKGEYSKEVENFFAKLDRYIGELNNKLCDGDAFIILSDHGFCGIKYEVQLNIWLEQQGLLKFESNEKKLPNYSKDTICYSLLPGRIFINLEGREEKGSVKRSEYLSVKKDIKKRLLNLTDPQTGEAIIDKIFFREEIYSGSYLEASADIIAHPKRGYDLKGKVDNVELFDKTHINGMHTFDDAFICARGIDIDAVESIQDVKSVIFGAMFKKREQVREDEIAVRGIS